MKDIHVKSKKTLTFILFECYLYFILSPVTFVDACSKISACSCRTEDGFKIDLSSLSNSDNTPRFSDVPSEVSPSTSYSWNPCSGFNEGTCSNVAVCQAVGSGSIQQYNSMGTNDNVQFETTSNGVDMKYTNGEQSVTIHVTCEKGTYAAFQPIGVQSGNQEIVMTLKTDLACKPPGLSPGTYICIVFLGLVVLYLIVGVVFQIFVRKESGKRTLPNYNFWTSFPGFVKDGVMFTVKCGKTGKGYSNI